MIRLFQVDAFTDRLFEGNPASVVLLSKWEDEAWMAEDISLLMATSAAPMCCPLSTWSPAPTSGRGVPPMLWCKGMTRKVGVGDTAIGVCVEASF